MGVTEYVLRHPFLLALGWALVHFLWQGAIAGVVAAVLMRAARGAAASTRYAIATIAMMVMVFCAAGTWVVLARPIGPAQVAARLGSLEGRVFPVINGAGKPAQAAGSHGVAAGSEDSALHGVTPPSATSTSARTIDATRSGPAPLALSIVLALYALGVLLLSIRLAGGWYLARRLTRRGVTAAGADLVAIADRVADRLALRRVVRVLESSLVTAPAIIGWLAPVVLLPAAALAGLSRAQLEALVAHELAHVKRHDYLVNLLQSAVETLLFYHPAVWWVSRQIRIEREHCCDDVAVEVCGDRVVYAAALADLETMRGAALALGANDGSLVSRVRRILSMSGEPRTVAPGWTGVALVLLMVSVAPAVMSSVRASKSVVADHATTTAKSDVSTQATKPAAYQIRSTDTLHIVVSGEPAMTRNYAVQSDGVIVFPLMRPLSVVGLTTDAVAAAIMKALTPATSNSTSTEAAEWLRQQTAEASAALDKAQVRWAKLSSYRVDDPATNIETCGVLSESELRADSQVRATTDVLKDLRAREVDMNNSLGSNHPALLQLRARTAQALASLRSDVQHVVEASQKDLDQARAVAVLLQARVDASVAGAAATAASKAPKVTVTIVKPGQAKIDEVGPVPVLAPAVESPAIDVAPVVSVEAPSVAPALSGMETVPIAPLFVNELAVPSVMPIAGVTVAPLPAVDVESPQTTPTTPQPQDEACPAALKPGPGVKNPTLQREVKPVLPDWAEQQGLRGVVELEVTVTPDGTTCGIIVIKSLEPRLDAEAVKAAKGWRFTPAESNGALVPIRVGIEMAFTGKPKPAINADATTAGTGATTEAAPASRPAALGATTQQSNKVYVVGEVKRSGAYTPSANMTVLQLLAFAGGATPDSALGRISITRTENGKAAKLNNVKPSELLQAGDVVTVPAKLVLITIAGAVKTPGITVRVGAGSTLLDVVNLAGGVATEGGEPGPPAFRIERLDPVTGKTIAIEAQASTIVQPGDVVTVRIPKDAAAQRAPDKVTVLGEVKNAGAYEPAAGMTVQQVLALAGGATPRAALSRIRVTRLVGDKQVVLDRVALTTVLLTGDVVTVPERFM